MHGVLQMPLWQVRPLQHWLLVVQLDPDDEHAVLQVPLWQLRPLQHWLLAVQL